MLRSLEEVQLVAVVGLTPAEPMLDLYQYPGRMAGLRMRNEVSLPAAVQRRVVAESDMTTAQAREGMSLLPLPLAVSGVRSGRVERLGKRLGGDNVTAFAADPSAPGAGSARDIVPGGNFAAAESYGDITTAAVGTTTDVCRGRALAFGHPLFSAGRTSLSAHSADALAIPADNVWGSFKIAQTPRAGPGRRW